MKKQKQQPQLVRRQLVGVDVRLSPYCGTVAHLVYEEDWIDEDGRYFKRVGTGQAVYPDRDPVGDPAAFRACAVLLESVARVCRVHDEKARINVGDFQVKLKEK